VHVDEVITHLNTKHGLDIVNLQEKYRMDQLSYIKFVNYIRKCIKESTSENAARDIVTFILAEKGMPAWSPDEYLKPVLEDDLMLTYWFDECSSNFANENGAPDVRDPGLADNTDQKLAKIQVLEETVAALQDQLNSMKSVMARLLLDEERVPSLKTLPKYDIQYFGSYDDVDIHDTMIFDVPRTKAYRLAILNNSDDFQNKLVLDIGCGTGILSMFAAQAGAEKVFAVDQSQIINKARELIRANGFEAKIQCIQGKLEEITLPEEKVDIILSEFMGYFLLFEGMLSSYIVARDKYLRPGGQMYPNSADLFIFASDDEYYANYSKRWEDVYGINMSLLQPESASALVETISPQRVITNCTRVLQLNLETCTYQDASFCSEFSLRASKACKITAICGYFDVGFTAGSRFSQILSTSPSAPSTHWFQTIFPLPTSVYVREGDEVTGRVKCMPNLKNPRSLDITFELPTQTFSYNMQ